MKAVVFDKELKLVNDYKKPVPKAGEALVKIKLAGVCNTDAEIIKGYMGYKGILGHEFIGVVEEVNDKDKSLVGKRVVGEISNACESCEMCHLGLQRHCNNRVTMGILNHDGCMAEYLTWTIKDLLVVPDNVTDEEAVLVEPLAAGLEILEQLHIQPIEKLLILGDGKLGLLTALGLHASNVDVTLVGKHQNKLDITKSQGIKTKLLSELEVKPEWDFVVEATGSSSGFETSMALTKPRGTLVLKSTVADSKPMNLAPIVINELRVQGSRCGRFKPALRLLASKKVDVKPIITDIFEADKALEAFEQNRAKDSVKVILKF